MLLAYAPPREIARIGVPRGPERPRLAVLVPAFAAESSDDALLRFAEGSAPMRALAGAPGLAGDSPVPLFGALEGASPPFARAEEDGVRRLLLRFDLLANVFLHLSRLEEALAPAAARDRFGRFPSSASVLAQHGLLRSAPVDRFAAWFADTIAREHPDPDALLARRALWPGGEPSAILLSHDVDQSVSWPRRLARDLAGVGRALAGERDPGFAEAVARTARHLAPANRDPACFPRALHAYERGEGLASSWFFLTVPSDSEGRRYRVASPPFPRLLREIAAGGSEVGLHGSIQAARDAGAMEAERRALEAVLGQAVNANRQHYLVIAGPTTFRDLATAGLRVDSSIGYSDVVGFRAGTSLPFRPYDLAREAPIDLLEIPLGVMDVALIQPGQRQADLGPLWTEILDRQAIVGGLLVVLWHPRMFDPETHPAGRAPYEALVRAGRARRLPFVTAGGVAQWWRAREGLRLAAASRTTFRYESAERLERATIVISRAGGAGTPPLRAEVRGAEVAGSEQVGSVLRLGLAAIRPGESFEIRVE